MPILLMLPLLFGNFVQKWVIPDGKNSYGRVVVEDIDHDGFTDIIVRRNQEIKVMFYELDGSNQWQLQDSIVDDGDHLLWGAGDFDLDGFSDLIFQKTFGMPNVGVAIYESPDSFSYPTQEVWRDTVGQPAVTPISVYDIDQDGFPEIVKVGANGIDFVIYEAIGDNIYARIYEDTIQGILTPLSTVAFGDFDGDNKIEFVLGNLSDGIGAAYWLYESPLDNTYEFVYLGSVSTKNIKDCFSIPDADGDGNLEFVAKGFVVPTARINAFIFEATGDNTYEIIDTFDLFGGHNSYYGGYSDVGDVDGDSIPEIALEGCQSIYLIKAGGNDSFYVWDTLPGNNSGSSVRVYDIDGNGLSEVIISGNDQTRIYEYEVGMAEEAACDAQGIGLVVSPNPFSNSTNIRCQITDDRQKCELKIYDITGRLVTDLSRQISVTSNQISVWWDGNGLSGHILPGGVYFLKLTIGDYTATEKLLLIR
jgi:hypothetical protein